MAFRTLRAMGLILVLALGGCAENSAVSNLAAPVSGDLPAPVSRESVRTDYRISSQDVLEVNVYQFQDLNRSLQVDGAGNIVMPLIGAVKASGRTVREVEADIKGKLGARFLQNPEVFVSIKSALGLQIVIEGAVKKPGTYMATGEMSLLRALAEAQGFTDTAAQGEVLVFRPTPKGQMIAKFDANAIRQGKAPDPAVYGGDKIVIDDSTVKTGWKQFREVLPVVGMFRLFI